MGEPELEGMGLRQIEGREILCHEFEPLLGVDELGLVGRHNVANCLAALAIGYAAGLDPRGMAQSLRRFKGLPHRCQQLSVVDGVRYVDDSKGTNIGATEAALMGLGGERDIVLIAGGQGKGADFKLLRNPVSRYCRSIVLIGEDAPAIEACLADLVPVTTATSMDEAVQLAAQQAQPGDCVLLSPACASFDMFSGYVERGQVFGRAVAELSERKA
jgi:UDP-N-acetylmuramoylalanine--D-glutamate ligase